MLMDITLPVTAEMMGTAWENTAKSLVGHLGTHFDVMDKEFPLEYTQRDGIVFDVSHIRERDIGLSDIDHSRIQPGMFVAFCTDFMTQVKYGTAEYFKTHPQLSRELVALLLERKVSVIGIDCGGIRRGSEHVPIDQKCADQGVFVIENLYGLKALLAAGDRFTARTFPLRYAGITGIPCRVADDPESCVAYGCGKSLAWINHMTEGPINIARQRMMKSNQY